MAVETRVYDNEHGDPVVVMVTTGTFDVSRLVGLMEKGRCEDGARAEAIIRSLRRHNGGKTALRLLADHGGPALLEPVVPDDEERSRRVHLAASDPGAVFATDLREHLEEQAAFHQELGDDHDERGRTIASREHWARAAALRGVLKYLDHELETR